MNVGVVVGRGIRDISLVNTLNEFTNTCHILRANANSFFLYKTENKVNSIVNKVLNNISSNIKSGVDKAPKTPSYGSKFDSSKFSKCITLSGKNSIRLFMLLLSGVIKLISLI
jgi:hypothetical protein